MDNDTLKELETFMRLYDLLYADEMIPSLLKLQMNTRMLLMASLNTAKNGALK